VPKFDLLVDGERKARVESEQQVREWLGRYTEEHRGDDPSATHVQIIRRGSLAWITGGQMVPREKFL
jgi:hypothetical protein